MHHAIGALLILIGIIVLIKYIMRTGEKKSSCAVEDNYPSDHERQNDDEVAEIADIEIDIKEKVK
jgi:hypothetical protein